MGQGKLFVHLSGRVFVAALESTCLDTVRQNAAIYFADSIFYMGQNVRK